MSSECCSVPAHGVSPGGCPSCGSQGKPVGNETLLSLLRESLRDRIKDHGYRFCSTRGCDVVYFRSGDQTPLVRADLAVPVWQKENDPACLVCYCFGHSTGSIRDEIRQTGKSSVQADIARNVRAGFCDCESKNPQGTCCLGNVGAVVKQEMKLLSDGDAPADSPRSSWLVGGSVAAALTASACCWLPIALGGVGVSAVGAGAVFERWRPVLLALAGLFLAAGFKLVYGRKAVCAPGSACENTSPRKQHLTRTTLWLGSALALAAALFPYYARAFGRSSHALPIGTSCASECKQARDADPCCQSGDRKPGRTP